MDIDQLKMILETIAGMEGDARQFTIAYLACTTVSSLINGALLFAFGVVAIRCISRSIANVSYSANVSNQIARVLGISINGVWQPSDEKEVLDEIHRLQELDRKSTKARKEREEHEEGNTLMGSHP